ncbi:MAG: DNA ligase [Firmicutes bacterium]|nr:DNA ligase [Bacillota bacterium]
MRTADGGAPAWPVPPQAMEPVLWPEAFDDPRFAFEIKWDGIRLLTWAGRGGLRAVTRRGRRREHAYPELAALAGGPEAVFDGEMVVFVRGRPSFPAVLRRDRASEPRAVERLARAWPAVYQVFDLLWEGGRDWRAAPWEERRARLERILEGRGGSVALVQAWPGERGRALFEAAAGLGLEGVVAKERASPYLPGRRSGAWRKIKAWRERDAVVGGYLEGVEGLASLLVGAYEGPALRYIGRAGSGLNARERQALRALLDRDRRASCPFEPEPARLPSPPVWVEPRLVARVRYLEWTPELLLRAPVVIAVREGDPHACRLEDGDLEVKGDGEGRGDDGLGGRPSPRPAQP